jgi:hypothetical protein
MSCGYTIAPTRKMTLLVLSFDRGAYHAPAVTGKHFILIGRNCSFPGFGKLLMREPPQAKVEADGV